MSEEVLPFAEREKRFPQTARKILAVLEEDGHVIEDLERVFDQVRRAIEKKRITQS